MGTHPDDAAHDEWRAFVHTFTRQIGQLLSLSQAFGDLTASESRARARPWEYWWVHRRFPDALYQALAKQGY